MDRIERSGPYDSMLPNYRIFFENKKDLIKRCIDLAVNTNLGVIVDHLDEREPEEFGLRFTMGDLEISCVSPPGSTSYVTVNYKNQRVLTGAHTSEIIELEKGSSEYYEFVEIERFIPGDWEREIDESYVKYFTANKN